MVRIRSLYSVIALTAVLACFYPSTAHAALSQVQIFTSNSYLQTSGTPPTTPSSSFIGFGGSFQNINEFNSASLQYPVPEFTAAITYPRHLFRIRYVEFFFPFQSPYGISLWHLYLHCFQLRYQYRQNCVHYLHCQRFLQFHSCSHSRNVYRPPGSQSRYIYQRCLQRPDSQSFH